MAEFLGTPVQPTPQNVHISDNFGKLLEPGLRKIFFETYKELPEQFPKIYNVLTSQKAKETDWGMGAFGDWSKRATNLSPVDYRQLSPGLERVYIHDAFTQGFMVERELADDEQYRQIMKMPAAMARSGRAKVEKDAITVLTNGFDGINHAIYDGKALFANDHPLLDSANTCSNLVTGALTDTNLKIAMQCMRETVDEAGNLVQFIPDTLVVPPSKEFEARVILESANLAGTDLNDKNVIQGRMNVVVMDYLGEAAGGNDNAWFIMDSKRKELNFFWRIKPEFKWEEDFDTFVAKYRGYMRYSYGISDWRGVVGSAG